MCKSAMLKIIGHFIFYFATQPMLFVKTPSFSFMNLVANFLFGFKHSNIEDHMHACINNVHQYINNITNQSRLFV